MNRWEHCLTYTVLILKKFGVFIVHGQPEVDEPYTTMASMEIPLFVVFTRQPLQRQRSVGRLRSPTAARRLNLSVRPWSITPPPPPPPNMLQWKSTRAFFKCAASLPCSVLPERRDLKSAELLKEIAYWFCALSDLHRFLFSPYLFIFLLKAAWGDLSNKTSCISAFASVAYHMGRRISDHTARLRYLLVESTCR